MKKVFTKGLPYILIIFLGVIIVLGISWLATCGVIKLITLCFKLDFSWGIATGIWLIMCLLSTTFKSNNK